MKSIVRIAALVLLFTTGTFAQNITWNFTSANSTSNTTSNVSSSALSSGNSNGTTTLISSTSVSSGYTGASGTQNAGVAARIGALNDGASGSAYFEVTLSSTNATPFTLFSLSFGSRSTGTGPKNFTVRSGVDNFASDLVTPGTLTTNSAWALYTANLTTVLSSSSSVVLRIYGYGGTGSPTAGTVNWRIDDLVLIFDGTPPPAPVSPVTNLTFSNVQTTSVKLGFTKTNYVDSIHQTLVFLKQDAAVTQGTPSRNPASYTANSDFQLSSSAYQNDAAAKCVLNSDLNEVTISNLVPGKTYHALVYVVRNSDSVYSSAATANVLSIDTAQPPQAPEYPLYNISQISKTNMTTGEPDSIGVKVMLRGIATGFNQRTSGISFVLTDATGGTTLFHATKTFGYTVTEGDSIYVKGVVATFRGLHEINMDTLWKGGTATVSLTATAVTVLNETTENKLIKLTGVRFATPPSGTTFGTASTNYPVITAANDTFTMRVLSTSALAGQALPATPTFTVTGLGAQFSTSAAAPFAFDGYQLFPRSAADIEEIIPERPVAISSINKTNMTTGNPDSLSSKVFVRGVALGFNQRAAGLLFVIDDGTGGISLFNSSKTFGYTVAEGDSIYAKGTVATFRGLTQIVLDTLWKVNGSTPIYTPAVVSTLSEQNENKLVRLNGVSFATAPTGTTWPTAATSINILTASNETVVIRIVANSGLAGQPLPATEFFDVIGLQGQFSTSTAAPFAFDGYQIFPRTANDIIDKEVTSLDSIGAFNLLSVANNTVITVDSPYTNTYVISWSKPQLFGNIDSVWYYFDLDSIGGDFSDPITLFSSNGDPDDTSFVLTEQDAKDLLDDLGILPGEQFDGRWQVVAETDNVFTVSTQTFNISIARELNSGLKERAFDRMVSVFPNPASGLVNIRHNEALDKVELFSTTGQKIGSQSAKGLNQVSMDLDGLAKGLYFITVYSKDGRSATRKLTVE